MVARKGGMTAACSADVKDVRMVVGWDVNSVVRKEDETAVWLVVDLVDEKVALSEF